MLPGQPSLGRALLLLLLSASLAGCGHIETRTGEGIGAHISHATTIELAGVPFFPQQTKRCGPAALATVAHYAGVTVTLEQLNRQVFLPGREGSLQYDLLGAARRNGLIPYVLDNTPEALLEQLTHNRPVVVLQNLALDWLPRWHYAVVIGYRPDKGKFVLRSGKQARKLTGTRGFLSSWDKSGRWAFVVLRPDEIPDGVDKARYLQAVTHLEGAASPEIMVRAFSAAATRWPEDSWVLTGLGNARFAAGDQTGAIAAFRQLLALQPDHIVARNNLAHLLALQGCISAARKEAETALNLTGNSDPHYASVQQTLTEINQTSVHPGADRNCDPSGFEGSATFKAANQ